MQIYVGQAGLQAGWRSRIDCRGTVEEGRRGRGGQGAAYRAAWPKQKIKLKIAAIKE